MNRSIRRYTVGAVVVALGLAACSSESSTGPGLSVPTADIDRGIATDVGEAIGTSIDLMVGDEVATGASGSVVPAQPGVSLAVQGNASVNCGGPDAAGWFTCEATNWRGLSVTRQVRFWEATSPALRWDAAKTDSVNHRRTVSGSFTSNANPAKTFWFNHADTATMVVKRGSTPVQHVWSGTGARHDSTSTMRNGATHMYHHTALDTVTAVTFNMPRSQYPWPQSGTVVHNLTTLFTAQSGARTYSRTLTRRAQVTFNGTQSVTLKVGELTCTLDLQTHAVSGCK
jgi:hypothetical protein